MKTKMDIRGTADIQNILNDIAPKTAVNLLRATNLGVAGEIRKGIRANAPTDGNPRTLSKSVKTKQRRRRGDTLRSDVVIDRNPGFFWRFHEHGTIKHKALHFVEKAVDSIKPNLRNIYFQQFGKKLDAAVKRAQKRARANGS